MRFEPANEGFADLPVEIQDRPDAVSLRGMSGTVIFGRVSFSHTQGADKASGG